MSPGLLLRCVAFFAIMGGLLFASARQPNLPFFRAYLGLMAAGWIFMLLTMDRDLLQERIQPGAGGADRSPRFIVLPLFAAHLATAGLDAGRFGWSHLPLGLRIFGLAGVAAGSALSAWARRVNRFYSPVVRIQAERGHHLISDGPYRLVRHPGHLGTLGLVFSQRAGAWPLGDAAPQRRGRGARIAPGAHRGALPARESRRVRRVCPARPETSAAWRVVNAVRSRQDVRRRHQPARITREHEHG